jgi:histidyl-tRNA synthetase
MAQKPGIPKGTRDFGPLEMERRNYIFNSIKQVYKKFGYKQIETPAMENLSTLLGKYGEEGDKLLFKILNSGDFLNKVNREELVTAQAHQLTSKISEKGLRYDLTVPFARFVVQHQNEINFPFKRFQIQPVWRADRPQKGRYREFFQCDSDVIGSKSLMNEAELVQIMDEVFQKLNIQVAIKINNRKILAGLAEAMDAKDKLTAITITLDKIDKIGLEKVMEEINQLGISQEALNIIQKVAGIGQQEPQEKLSALEKLIGHTEIGAQGIAELNELFELIGSLEIANRTEIDLTLARGLNYYTGAIFEVISTEMKMGSICGGGRYDDLTGIFGLSDMSGVGVSFGADRIYDVLTELKRFPASTESGTQLMIVNFGREEAIQAIGIARQLRKAGIQTELFPDAAKIKKQMNYANKNSIGYVLMAGTNEIESGVYQLKNMESGEQLHLPLNDIIQHLK